MAGEIEYSRTWTIVREQEFYSSCVFRQTCDAQQMGSETVGRLIKPFAPDFSQVLHYH
jgi:hypothetical protein